MESPINTVAYLLDIFFTLLINQLLFTYSIFCHFRSLFENSFGNFFLHFFTEDESKKCGKIVWLELE